MPYVDGDEPYMGAEEICNGEVVPTCVGINRIAIYIARKTLDSPYMRGDEPYIRTSIDDIKVVVPTCVGMNRMLNLRRAI